MIRRILAVLLVATFGPTFPASAEEPSPPTLEQILEKWEDARRKCQVFDADIVCFGPTIYSCMTPAATKGHFYFEDSSHCRWDNCHGQRESWIWQENQALEIDWAHRRYAAHDRQTARDALQAYSHNQRLQANSSRSFWQFLSCLPEYFLVTLCRAVDSPTLICPLTMILRPEAKQLSESYEISLLKATPEVWLKAVPKPSNIESWFTGEILIIVDPHTYLTRAIRVAPKRKGEPTDYVLENVVINRPREDRQTYLHPALTGFRYDADRSLTASSRTESPRAAPMRTEP